MKLTKDQEAIAARFQSLMGHEAWKLLEKMCEDQKFLSMKTQDDTEAIHLNINKVCEERGFRKGIRWVIDQVKTKADIG